MESLYSIPVVTIEGKEQTLADYSDRFMLIVNTASKCGFTKQYEGLEKLYKNYKDKGLVILGFPCNQFAHQEPGSSDEIAEFCSVRFGVTFPLFEKVDVNGKSTHPLYEQLKKEAPGILGSQRIKWNFTKFLVWPKGGQIKRFGSNVEPEKIEEIIKKVI